MPSLQKLPLAWVPDDVGDLQTPEVEHRSEFNPDDNGDDVQPLRVLVQMAQVSVPKMSYVIVWGGGSCLAGPNLSVVHTFGNLESKFIKLFTLCWRVCPTMHCRMGEEGSCPAWPVQIYQWFKLLESCKGSLLNPSTFQGCALCMCVCVCAIH